MKSPVAHDVSRLLEEWRNGSARAAADLMPLVYAELRALAASYLLGERQGHTLQPTALVHEAYLRLVEQASPDWQGRGHFYGIAARVMRQILVDHARRRSAGKRAGIHLPLEDALGVAQERGQDLVALDDALTDLGRFDERKCQVVELRYFAGLGMEEIATVVGLSVETVRRDLRLAEAWLRTALRDG